MSKKKSKKKKVVFPELPQVGRGFEFGDQEGVLFVTDHDFIQALAEAEIIGCAYGVDRMIEGFPSRLPLITLVGKNQEPLQRAFNHFAQWGCEEDGDAVDVQILLKTDGTYRLAITPDSERSMFRLASDQQIVKPLIFCASWIKYLDTTNPILLDLADYCRSSFSPVVISAAIVNPTLPLGPDNIVTIPNLPRLLKFGLKIDFERDNPNHWLIQFEQKNKRPRAAQQGGMSQPKEFAQRRRRTIDTAFPVSCQRIKRAGLLDSVRKVTGFENVSNSQIEQAAINLILSAELSDGQYHFITLEAKDFRKNVWEYIFDRWERADGKDAIKDLSPELVATQLRLDVIEVLTRRGASTSNLKMSALQAMFLRKGYANE